MNTAVRRALPVALLLIGATLALWIGLWLRQMRPPVSLATPPAPTLAVTFCPVGNGEAAWIRTPHNKFIVVGCGTPGSESGFIQSLRDAGTHQIDAVFLPYPYAEAIGGAEGVLRSFPVAAAYEPTPQNDAPVNQWHKKVRQVCRDKKIRLETIAEGQVFTLDGVRVDVLAPAKIALATPPTGANNALILRVRWRKTTFLLAGGVSQAGENALLSRPADLQADVLRVARMGDKSATSPELLRRVNPHFFVISAASAPQAGSKEAGGETYPHEETIKRLQAVGAPIWQTGTAPLTFVSDGTKISPPDTPPLLIQ